ncbi:MAG TPA: PIN domain-containing protein [Bryobacteraceae bacterium]|nr:PIN domain-containing protein [Bryobacteraceae bacterium]
MKRLLFDINVILDVALRRQPHFQASATLWAAIELGKAEGLVSGHAATTIYYLFAQAHGKAAAGQSLALLMRLFTVAATDGPTIQEALDSGAGDFEDAVTAAAARRASCDFIVTRDPKGFRGSKVRALSPEAVLPLLIV